MSNGKPNILGKLPVHNPASELFDSSSDARVLEERRMQRKGDYARSDTKSTSESKTRPKKKTKSTKAKEGSAPTLSRRGPVYSGSSKTASDKGKGSAKAQPPKLPPKKGK